MWQTVFRPLIWKIPSKRLDDYPCGQRSITRLWGMTKQTVSFQLFAPEDTDELGRALAKNAKPGDCILLRGQIGAGKSAFARAFIRARLGQDTEVPSPTFTLVQTYDDNDVEIWHADLYRLSDTQEAVELGLTDAFDKQICLIEWPEILDNMLPETALNINLSVHDTHHLAAVTFDESWATRLPEAIAHA